MFVVRACAIGQAVSVWVGCAVVVLCCYRVQVLQRRASAVQGAGTASRGARVMATGGGNTAYSVVGSSPSDSPFASYSRSSSSPIQVLIPISNQPRQLCMWTELTRTQIHCPGHHLMRVLHTRLHHTPILPKTNPIRVVFAIRSCALPPRCPVRLRHASLHARGPCGGPGAAVRTQCWTSRNRRSELSMEADIARRWL